MTTPFRTTRRVEFADTDMAGIVHFANFFRYMEAAEVDFLLARGMSVHMHWEGLGIGFPRVSASCDYLRPARFGDMLTVSVMLEKVGSKSLTYAFEFTRDAELIARGGLTCVCCRVNSDGSFVSVEVPAGLRERLRQES
ncbi:MAG TPA: thioesterase family protein [Gemmataceae bacterium]|nr:thioesterase family protein [Gemmataceae bacterium]